MGLSSAISIAANFALISGLVYFGFRFFAEYHSQGKWTKNATSLLAGLGLLTLAGADLLSSRIASLLVVMAHSRLPAVLLWVSNGLLVAGIVAFGIITYTKPLRLWHERKIERDLHRERPNIP
jgi:hypothetical protein